MEGSLNGGRNSNGGEFKWMEGILNGGEFKWREKFKCRGM